MTVRSLLVSAIIILAMAGSIALVFLSFFYMVGVAVATAALSFLVEYVCSQGDRESYRIRQERLDCITQHLGRELKSLDQPTDAQIESVIRRHIKTALFE